MEKLLQDLTYLVAGINKRIEDYKAFKQSCSEAGNTRGEFTSFGRKVEAELIAKGLQNIIKKAEKRKGKPQKPLGRPSKKARTNVNKYGWL